MRLDVLEGAMMGFAIALLLLVGVRLHQLEAEVSRLEIKFYTLGACR